MQSKLFIVTLFAALAAFVAATASVDDAIVIKRAALEARMHQRNNLGHGALKKRQSSEAEQAAKERIRRAQYHPTRTAAAAPGMEKRQFGISVPCVSSFGGVNLPIGCTPAFVSQPGPSAVACSGTNYDGCNPGSNIGAIGSTSFGSSSGGISQCCQTGYTCQQLGPFQASFCLNLVGAPLYNLNEAIAAQTFYTQQEFADFLAGRKSMTG